MNNMNSSAKQIDIKVKLRRELNMATISESLRIRKYLQKRIALISDIMSILAIISIILMIIMNELIFTQIDHSETDTTWFIKLFISITTFLLLILIAYYHYLDLRLYANHNGLKHHRIGLTNIKIGFILIEFLICMIHPMPRAYPYSISSNRNETTSSNSYPLSHTATDVAFGLPMFLRLYLLSRSIMFHSHLLRDASLRSFGYLNQVSINFSFVTKTFFAQWPTRSLLGLCILAFFIGSWSIRACNYAKTGEHFTFSDSMWLFIITFATVGYGDIYPSTYCGRTINAIVCLFGLLASTLIIAVLSQKILLTREEKYVHTFVLNIELEKERQNQAANVIKFVIKLWCLHRRDRQKYLPYMFAQRKLFQAIHRLQNIKNEQRKLVDHCIGSHELLAMQRNLLVHYEKTEEKILDIQKKMIMIEGKLDYVVRNISKENTVLKH